MDGILKPGMADNDASAPQLSILCVDDEKNVLRALERLFWQEAFTVLTAASGEEGLAILRSTENVGLILSDQRMPEMTGTVFLQAAAALRPDIPRMILTGYSDVTAAIAAINEGGAYRFLTKPWNEPELLQAVRDGLDRSRLLRENRRLTALVRQQNEELSEWNDNMKKRILQQTAQLRQQIEALHLAGSGGTKNFEQMVLTFTDLLGLRSLRFVKHMQTVVALTEQIAQKLGLEQRRRDELRMAALLHDLGKIGLSELLLAKGKELLTPDEAQEYRSHPVTGQSLLDKFGELREVGVVIRHHHEAFDGSGVPDGLAGAQIPLGARILALANWIENTFSRVTSPNAKYELTKKLLAEMGRLFDPALSGAATFALMQVLVDPLANKDMVEVEVKTADLGVGMFLSRNIYSATGILLLARGTRLDDTEIVALRSYLEASPNTPGVFVSQKSIEAIKQWVT